MVRIISPVEKSTTTASATSPATFLPYTVRIGAGPITVEGRPDPEDRSNVALIRYVTPDFLKTLGVPLLRGRGFSDRDTSTPAVAIVSERVTAFFDGDPMGQRIAFGSFGPASMTVVGVVGDIKGEGLDVPNTRGTVYVPAAQLDQIGLFSPRALAIRTTSDPSGLVAAVQREIWAVNPNQTIANVRTLESIVEGQISDRKVQTGLFTAFAGLALFMAALGVYSLLSFVVTSRMPELGVRTALGAQRRDLVSPIARDSAVWVACGLVGGLALAVIVSRSMSSLIYGVEPLDWISLTTSTCVLGTPARGEAKSRAPEAWSVSFPENPFGPRTLSDLGGSAVVMVVNQPVHATSQCHRRDMAALANLREPSPKWVVIKRTAAD
jgi:ABC-type antimicrobial peptide transport system permease subunit